MSYKLMAGVLGRRRRGKKDEEYALSFNGTSHYVLIPDRPAEFEMGTNDFKIETEVLNTVPTTTSGIYEIFSLGTVGIGQWQFFYSNGNLRFYANGGDINIISPAKMPVNEYFYAAFERVGDIGNLYMIDKDIPVISISGIDNVDISGVGGAIQYAIGASHLTATTIFRYWNGNIKNLKFTIANNIVADYPINEGAGCEIIDKSIYGNNGLLEPDCPTDSPQWIEI